MITDEVNHIELPDFGLVIALPLTIHNTNPNTTYPVYFFLHTNKVAA